MKRVELMLYNGGILYNDFQEYLETKNCPVSDEECLIYYYTDINSFEYREFSNLIIFDLYLYQEGIEVNERDYPKFYQGGEIHCVLSPGLYNNELIVSNSYEGMLSLYNAL